MGKGYLQNSLKVERKEGKAKEHAQKNHEEDAKDQFEIEWEHRQRKEIIDGKTIDYCNDSKYHVWGVALLFFIKHLNIYCLGLASLII